MEHDLYQKVDAQVKSLLNITRDINYDEVLDKNGLDSLKMMSLIINLEESFDITFDDEVLLFENFSTIEKISQQIRIYLNR
jgi:acyl carrier protein